MAARIARIPEQLIFLLLKLFYMKTASKDYKVFEKQTVLIIRRIKVSIKDQSIFMRNLMLINMNDCKIN